MLGECFLHVRIHPTTLWIYVPMLSAELPANHHDAPRASIFGTVHEKRRRKPSRLRYSGIHEGWACRRQNLGVARFKCFVHRVIQY